MPGQGRKHLQLAEIGAADAWPGSEASATCWNWICRCLVGVVSICNLLELDLQMHIGVNSGRGSIHNLLELDLQMPGRVRKHPQLAGFEFVDAWSGSEASAICQYWSCRCLVGVGSIHNLLDMNLQMPITKLILRILQQLRWDCFLCRKRAKCSYR